MLFIARNVIMLIKHSLRLKSLYEIVHKPTQMFILSSCRQLTWRHVTVTFVWRSPACRVESGLESCRYGHVAYVDGSVFNIQQVAPPSSFHLANWVCHNAGWLSPRGFQCNQVGSPVHISSTAARSAICSMHLFISHTVLIYRYLCVHRTSVSWHVSAISRLLSWWYVSRHK